MMNDEGMGSLRWARIIISCLLSSIIILHSALPARAQVDTIRAAERTSATPDTGAFHMTKSPLEAILLSAAIPGAGQAYLDQWWKVPIIWGLGGGFLYGAYIQNFRYHYTQDTITNAYARHTPGDSLWAMRNEPVREFYRDDRDKWWIYVGLTYIATLLDAYIAANLYDFDVSNPSPTPIGSFYDPSRQEYGLALRIRF
ncbi:MAG: DUF5683 domain-containing protein [Bacteroidota bacterium]|nr:DUF5683 domain-containing protein [Bacteroidota bacterium]MDP4233369.1 DUF5683 domain-containing protein [Bacteroidota bacterium]MDP4242235.1 DUF5683 domain-containing protein [Bacteroidota bacterium]MDP4286991.1 DUF5683 domain-containing protein [Bacteroidota bacterium]